MKKNIIFIICLILCIIIFIYYYNKPKNYTLSYQINDFKVTEKYDINKNIYFFTFKLNDLRFETVLKQKYSPNRKIISEVNLFNVDKTTCITTNLTIPLCKNADKYVAYSLASKQMKDKVNYQITNNQKINGQYQNIEINNYQNHAYAIWNYKGFDYISEDNKATLNFFANDTYNVDIISQINNYIIIADYDETYSFNMFYILDMEKGTYKRWKIEYDISFDSYILGANDRSIYLVDRKNKIEYEIVPHKRKMRIIGTVNKPGKILIKSAWKEISLKKLVSKEYEFTEEKIYDYFLNQQTILLRYAFGINEIQVSDKKVTKLVSAIEKEAFYLVDDKLYVFNDKNFETFLLRKYEWNFNNQNVIFVY